MSKKHLDLYSFNNKKELKMKYIRTPKEIWEELSSEFVFTVDACASDKNHLVDKYWTKENSALDNDWNNEIIYSHPMYDSAIPKFIKKAYESNCLCVFLLPSSTNSLYFHEYFWDYKNCKSYSNIEIRFLAKRNNKKGFKFATDDGIEPETGYLRPLMIVVMDNRNGN